MRVLITGGTGTIGAALRETKADSTYISVLSRCEHRQVPLRGVVDCHIGDVADEAAVRRAVARSRPDVVIHAAAIKHVSTGELDPLAAVRTNVIGTRVVVDAARSAGASIVLVSTDKAVMPTTAYGASKMLAERIVVDSGGVVVRYGNVFGSTGSYSRYLLEQWVRRGRDGSGLALRLTAPDATRYWWSPLDAARFVWGAVTDSWTTGRGLYVPRLKSCSMSQLCDAMLPGHDRVVVGLSAAEKTHETMLCHEDGEIVDATIGGSEACVRCGYIDRGGYREELVSQPLRMTTDDIMDLCARAAEELGIVQ